MLAGARETVWGNGLHALCFTAKQANSVVRMVSFNWNISGHTYPAIHLEYSRDGVSWATFINQPETATPLQSQIQSETVTLQNVGDKVYIRAPIGVKNARTCENAAQDQAAWVFGAYGNLEVSGDVTSLLGNDPMWTFGNADWILGWLFFSTQITSAKNLRLPTRTLSANCYSHMFYGCYSLVEPPEILPALTLAEGCYDSMFYGDYALTASPTLAAETMVTDCYNKMFYGCTVMAKIRTMQKSFTGCTQWQKDVAATGTLICDTDALGNGSSIERGESACPSGWTVEELAL